MPAAKEDGESTARHPATAGPEHYSAGQHERGGDGAILGRHRRRRCHGVRGLSRAGPPATSSSRTDRGYGHLSAHRAQRVKELIEECGYEVLYLPPYSPDLNPIEESL